MLEELKREANRDPGEIPETEHPYRNMYQDMRAFLGLKSDPMYEIQAIPECVNIPVTGFFENHALFS